MTGFTDLGLAETLLRAVAAEGYTDPTPIQRAAIPAILAGEDVVGIAQTGTGKTAAFVLPLLQQLAADRRRPEPRSCEALILAPTRELAQQIGECIRTYGRFMRPSFAVVIGGAGMGGQVRALSHGVEIVIATPGRLLDHLASGTARVDRARLVVLDEADQMLDLGFLPAIRRIMRAVPRERQTIMVSATMPPALRALASDFLSNPREVAVASASKPVDRIEQKVLLVEGPAKASRLAELLSAPDVERAIVFTRTKRGADKVTAYLDSRGIAATAIHGNKSQGQRERALGAFRGDQVRVLVATDIAARGIDVDGVSHVINFELPNVPEAYVHRIGRTARAGAVGVAISLCAPDERSLLRDIEKLIGRRLVEPGAPMERAAPGERGPVSERGSGPGARSQAARPHGQHSHRSNGQQGQRPQGQGQQRAESPQGQGPRPQGQGPRPQGQGQQRPQQGQGPRPQGAQRPQRRAAGVTGAGGFKPALG